MSEMVFKHCVFGEFDESTLSTYCMKYFDTCKDWKNCNERIERIAPKVDELIKLFNSEETRKEKDKINRLHSEAWIKEKNIIYY